MKVALIDASLKPLSKGKRGGTLGRSFWPSVELMKAFAFCRKERMDARMLVYREEMEDLTGYQTVVVAMGNPHSRVPPAIQLVLERLGWPEEGGKRLMDSLYDMHEGTDLCVVGPQMRPEGEAVRMGAEIDSTPADIDAYGETLYLRNRLDEKAETASMRMIDLAYGRILCEDGTWSSPRRMGAFSGSRYMVLDDRDPAGIPEDVMEGFMSEAASNGNRLHFRYPVALDRLGRRALDAICSVRWFGGMLVEGDALKDKEALLRLADVCSAYNICIYHDGYARGLYKPEDHASAIRDMLFGMYNAERLGVSCAYRLSDEAVSSRFGRVYSTIRRWHMVPKLYQTMTVGWYIRWTAQKMREKNPRAADELMEGYEELCRDPGLRELMEGYSGKSVRRLEYVFKEAA